MLFYYQRVRSLITLCVPLVSFLDLPFSIRLEVIKVERYDANGPEGRCRGTNVVMVFQKLYPMTMYPSVTATSHPNIALIKYWGKRDLDANIPLTGSISITLPKMITQTRIEENYEEDVLIIDGKKHEINQKMREFLGLMKSRAKPRNGSAANDLTVKCNTNTIQTYKCNTLETIEKDFVSSNKGKNAYTEAKTVYFTITSTNNFPLSCGLASSASGMSALVKATVKFFNLDCSPYEMLDMTRRLSGSACRSLMPDIVYWRVNYRNEDDVVYASRHHDNDQSYMKSMANWYYENGLEKDNEYKQLLCINNSKYIDCKGQNYASTQILNADHHVYEKQKRCVARHDGNTTSQLDTYLNYKEQIQTTTDNDKTHSKLLRTSMKQSDNSSTMIHHEEELIDLGDWADVKIFAVIVSKSIKNVSSTVGMQRTVKTASLFSSRIANLNKKIAQCLEYIKTKDLEKLGCLVMQESDEFHAVCLNSSPPLMYLNDNSRKIIDKVYQINHERFKCFYTFDAGPNGFIFTLEKDYAIVKAGFKELGFEIIVGR